MNYKIVEKPAWTAMGKAVKVSTVDGENLVRIPQFWNECNRDGTVCELVRVAAAGHDGQTAGNLLGICREFINEQEFSYVVGIETAVHTAVAGWDTFTIPALTWAIFESVGPMPQSLQSLLKRIYGEFLPGGGYERADGPDIEVYFDGDLNSPDYRAEVWVPVIRK